MTRIGHPFRRVRVRVGDTFERGFTLDTAGEAWVALTMSAPGTSWLRAESAVVTLEVDGCARQDVILAGGDEAVEYHRFLGRLSSGVHHLRLEVHRGLSFPGVREVTVSQVRTGSVGDSDPLAVIWRHAPVIHYRALHGPLDSLTTDTPLILFYRMSAGEGRTLVEYHTIFSHEDAGTDLTGLLARWGHTVDIEWIFRITLDERGRAISEEFQGPGHDTTPFRGGRAMGEHPVLQIATQNGMVTDRLSCLYRAALAPVCAQPAGEPREGVLQQFPWIYRVSALEVLRQVHLEASSLPSATAPADLRSYLYLQWKRLGGPAVPLEACARVGDAWYTSAWGQADLAFDEPDAESTAVKLPLGATEADVSAIALRVLGTPHEPLGVALVRAFFLDEGYRPCPSLAAPAVCRLSAVEPQRMIWTRAGGQDREKFR